MQDFKKLLVWQKSHGLTLRVYSLTKTFPTDERFGLVQQIRGSAVSVESNIAEGSARGGDAEFRRFTYVALASACELECQLLVAKDLAYLAPAAFDDVNARGIEIRRMLWSLIRRLERRP